MSDLTQSGFFRTEGAARAGLGGRLLAAANSPAGRRILILALLALGWEAAARFQNNAIMLPTFLDVAATFLDPASLGEIASSTASSLAVLLKGYLLAVALALVLVSLAVANGFARDVLTTLTAMFNPLPAGSSSRTATSS